MDRAFDDLLEHVDLIALTVDVAGRITSCNEFLLHLTGWSREDVIGSNWYEKFVPAKAEWQREVRELLAAGTGPRKSEYPILTRSGEVRNVRWSNAILHDDAGHVRGLASIGEDVTERRRADAALRASEERLRQLAESIREVFWLTDAQTFKPLYVSQAYEKIWGRSCESELSGPEAWLEAIHPDDQQRVAEAFKNWAVGQYDIEYRIIQPGGMVRWIRDRGFPVHDEHGKPYRIAGVAEDITERKLAEAARKATEERFVAVFESAPIGIGLGRVDGRMVDVNEQLAQQWGYHREEIRGRTVFELNVWVDSEQRKRVIERLERDGRVLNEEVRFRRKSGEIRTTLLSLQKLVLANEPVFLSMQVDVTEQKALEAHLRRAERMESVGQLASGIAHDMNNILSPIVMGAPLLRVDPVEDREGIVSRIEVSARRGANLARQLMMLGRGMEGERGPVELRGLICEVAKMSAETFPKNIDVHVDVPVGLRQVQGNASQLHQVLLNLAVNARDAMPEGGRLEFSARDVDCGQGGGTARPEIKPGRYVRITVADTGVGIPPEIADKIFEPFYTTKQEGHGTGLGLSTVASVIKSHEGLVTFQSRAGHGCTFEVLLPAIEAAGATMAEADAVPLRGQGEMILVVDDEPSVVATLRSALLRYGYRVITASDGAEAMDTFCRYPDDVRLVIADLDMPVVDGTNLARMLRRIRSDLPLVISTALSEGDGLTTRRTELASLGIKTVISKPYTAERLLREVRDSLKRRN